jgi:hypothetical protein
MRTLTFRASALALVALVLSNATAVAQDSNLTRGYEVTAKAGMAAQLETAIMQHAQWRKANNDPWVWIVYTTETGDNLGTFVIRSGNHTWADFDAYDQGFGPEGLTHWNATVAPLVESITSAISRTLPDNNQLPPDGTQIAFVTVTTFHLRPGMEAQFNQLVTQAIDALKAKNWPGYWVWASPVTGGGRGPMMYLAGLYASWADMQEPEPSFEAVMMEALGQDGFMEWAGKIGESTRGTEVVTYRFRPDLSVLPSN